MKHKITFFLKKSRFCIKNTAEYFFSKKSAGILLCFLCASLLLTFSAFALTQHDGEEEIFSETLRFHVLANSDAQFDQELKLEVKNAVFAAASELFSECTDICKAQSIAQKSADYLQDIARRTIIENGYSYDVRIEVGKESYPEKHYENFTFPAGEYISLKVIIGKGEGKNWWCVLFPPLCTQVATKTVKEVESVLSENGFSCAAAEFITDDSIKTKVRFMALDIMEKLFKE